VTFVKVARFGQHNEEVIAVCGRVVRNPERFAQLGAGWALRELSLADRDRVVEFLRSHYACVSREGLRYAIEKMPASLQRRLLTEHTTGKHRS
jgi:3-methyladenine DNA glycosylase AlkD